MRAITMRALAAPSVAVVLALGWASPALADIHLCRENPTQEAAQGVLDQNPGLAGTLDRNGDGIACNEGGAEGTTADGGNEGGGGGNEGGGGGNEGTGGGNEGTGGGGGNENEGTGNGGGGGGGNEGTGGGGGNENEGTGNVPRGDTGVGEAGMSEGGVGSEVPLAALGGLTFLATAGVVVVRRRRASAPQA
ncbi:MAG: hypothetical protein M3Q27_12455 [Actinomycetota bacterium]|nr:hypothetical protein [Actinomycetota bacterium]